MYLPELIRTRLERQNQGFTLPDGLVMMEVFKPSTGVMDNQVTPDKLLASVHIDKPDEDNRRSESDRRAEDRRRSAQGLFELRARRDRVVEDRRRTDRRDGPRWRLAFWRRNET